MGNGIFKKDWQGIALCLAVLGPVVLHLPLALLGTYSLRGALSWCETLDASAVTPHSLSSKF